MIGGPSHGSLVPVILGLRCDAPGCSEQIDLTRPCAGALEEIPAGQALRAEAESIGWYVCRDRSAKNQSWDLCPRCAGAAAVRNAGRMR